MLKSVGVSLVVMFNIFFTIAGGVTGQTPAIAGINDGLVAYYPFDGNANDASGNGNNLTAYGPVPTTDLFNNTDSAYSFDVDNDYLRGVIQETDFSAFSISYWFYTTDQGMNTIIGLYENSSGTGGAAIRSDIGVDNAGSVRIWLQEEFEMGPPRQAKGTSENFADGQWHHVVITRSGPSVSDIKLYLDGTNISDIDSKFSETISSALNASVVVIGANHATATNRFFSGKLDEVRIYNRAITESEVRDLYRYDIYHQGYQAGLSAGNGGSGGKCASFDFFTSTLHIPCFTLENTNYWLDLGVYSYDPLLFDLRNFGVAK